LVFDIQRRLIEGFVNPKVFKFLHLPVQSGDDTVLKSMRRLYTSKKFKDIVDVFRSEFPDLTLATDVIVGFPGETEQAFQNTLELLREVEPDVTNVSKFFARPKTAAWDMKDGLIDQEEIKRRSTTASNLVKKLSAKRNKRWVGWTGKILVDERGKISGTCVGRNFAYKPIVVKSKKNLLGKELNVKVVEASETYLRGSITKQ
jgi:tRNA A37 methylthiotransferase MiaB